MKQRKSKAGTSSSCAFCGSTSGFSKKHVWPQWLRPYAGELEPRRSTHSYGFGQTDRETFTELPTITVEQPGSVLSMTTREVWGTCNNGWMSRLEMQARTLLVPLMDAASVRQVTTIEPDDAARLATWAVKTAWMRELSASSVSQQSKLYLYLRTQLLPPPDSSIWIGRHSGLRNFDILQAKIDIRHRDLPWNHGEIRNALRTNLTFRELSLLVHTVNGPGTPAQERDPERWLRLWPASATLRFPPRFAVSDSDVWESVAIQAPYLRVPDLPHFRRDRAGPQTRRRN